MATTSLQSSLTSRVRGFLMNQAAEDFAEAVEVQCAVPGYPLLIGAAFPLSLVARALDQSAPDDPAVQAVVSRLVETLVGFGDEDGWRYFTICPDIPPDTDDLAQVVTILAERGHPERAALLAGPLRRLVLNSRGPGRFRTWLVAAPEEAEAADRTWVAGSDPVHPEVVANVLFALWRHDADAWREDVLAGARWLLTRQVDGLWASYWYYGHGYATHLVLRLLAAIDATWPDALPGCEVAQLAARRALLGAQGPDGSWPVTQPPLAFLELGAAWEPGPERTLETALCLSALAYVPSDETVRLARSRAIAYLASVQAEDGGFAADPYYFTMGRIPHQSRCLTAAAVLSALTSAHHVSG